MVRYTGGGRLAEFELGNEPELFGNPNFGWYLRHGRPVMGRPRGYDRAAFTRDFARIGRALPRQVPLAGPASNVSRWIVNLGAFLSGVPRLGLVTMHRYPFAACFLARSSPAYPTINRLLSPVASTGQAAGLVPFIGIAHARHLRFSVDEMNSVSCGSPPGVTNSFALALWVVDALFADAAAGADNVEVHTWPGAVYQLFTFAGPAGGWRGSVYPEYYGLLLFERAAPPGSTLVSTTTDNSRIRAWATRGADGRTRVVLINDDTGQAHQISIGLAGGSSPGSATVELLRAPGAAARGGVSIAGQGFGAATRTGVLHGVLQVSQLQASSGTFTLELPAATAALVTLG